MSMQSYESRGCGVQFDENGGTNTTGENIRAMLEFAPNLKEKVNEWLKECEINPDEAEVEDYAEYDQDFYNGIPALIAAAMNEHYGSDFMCAESDEDGILYLYMPCGMPWEFDEFSRGLNFDSLSELISNFCGILYKEKPYVDLVSIHNFG